MILCSLYINSLPIWFANVLSHTWDFFLTLLLSLLCRNIFPGTTPYANIHLSYLQITLVRLMFSPSYHTASDLMFVAFQSLCLTHFEFIFVSVMMGGSNFILPCADINLYGPINQGDCPFPITYPWTMVEVLLTTHAWTSFLNTRFWPSSHHMHFYVNAILFW